MDNLSFAADITLVTGRSNTRTDSELSVTNDITEDIALKLAHSRQYHDKVPEGLSKADSVFSVNLLSLFNPFSLSFRNKKHLQGGAF